MKPRLYWMGYPINMWVLDPSGRCFLTFEQALTHIRREIDAASPKRVPTERMSAVPPVSKTPPVGD